MNCSSLYSLINPEIPDNFPNFAGKSIPHIYKPKFSIMKFITKALFAVVLSSALLFSAWAQAQNTQKNARPDGRATGNPGLLIQSGQVQLFDMAPYTKQGVLPGTKAQFDLQFSFVPPIPSGLATGVETDGTYIYASVFSNAYFYRYTLAGALVDSFTIAGVSAIRDLAYDGQYFYGAAANNLIRQMDFTSHTLVSTITAPASVAARHIAYDPVNDAFWCGNWADQFSLVSKTGTVLQTIPAANHLQTSAYGSAYDGFSSGGPYLWIYNQDAPNGNNIVQISIATGAPTGLSLDVATKVTVPATAIAGGLFITDELYPNKATIGGCVQNEMIWGLEMLDLAVFDNDVSPTVLVAPTSATLLTAAEDITVRVANLDTADHWDIPVTYVIDGGAPVNDTIFDTIPSGSSFDFTFAVQADMSAPGHVYDIVIYTSLAGDLFPANDTLEASVTNLWDVAPISIDEPPVLAPGNVDPKVTVRNEGTIAATFDVTLEIQGGYTDTETVTNLAPGATQQVTFATWAAAIGTYDMTVYTVLAADSVPSNDTLTGSIQVMPLTRAFIYNAYDPSAVLPEGPAETYLQTPDMITSLADQTGTSFVSAGTWGYGNKWFGAVYGDNTLISIDTLTGARTVIGNIGKGISGMAYDFSTNTLFGVDWDGAASNLYKINILSGAATFVGSCGSALMINLACDLSGNLYAAAITDDNFYSIDPVTGAATIVGPLGFDAAYAQDMEFDLNSDILYMAAYNNATGGELRIVNPADGSSVLIGAFAGDAEITGMAIPYITTLPANDAALASINGLESGCALDSDEEIEVSVHNMGTANITTFNMTYVVDGGTPVTETVTQTILPGASYDYTFTATADLSAAGDHDILVYVVMTGDNEQWNDTVSLTVSQLTPETVPYSMGFEPTEDLAGYRIIDANNDGVTWFLSTAGGNNAPACMEYSYTTVNIANDWFITTCINLDAGVTYNISYYYVVESATYPESFRVTIGMNNTVATQTTQLASHTGLTNETYVNANTNFTVPATGTYYIGFQCTSPADMWNLYVDDINISVSSGIEKSSENGVSIYPNPVNGMMYVVAGETVQSVKVTNMVGALVYSENPGTDHFSLNTEDWNKGMYFITLETVKGQFSRKFVVE
mgnify:CR=1 FL=1